MIEISICCGFVQSLADLLEQVNDCSEKLSLGSVIWIDLLISYGRSETSGVAGCDFLMLIFLSDFEDFCGALEMDFVVSQAVEMESELDAFPESFRVCAQESSTSCAQSNAFLEMDFSCDCSCSLDASATRRVFCYAAKSIDVLD